MNLSNFDWTIIIAFFLVTLGIGLYVSKQSGKSAKEFFLSGNNMPWWLLGVSMVATTFSADTPNLVTDIVRQNGVAGNWAWWAFLLTGMLTVFVYAKLWRRSGIMTDLEFYELRYSGPSATFLRGFRAIYLGVFFNVVIMATVMLAGIKIGGIMLGLTPVQTVVLVSLVTVVYSSMGGLRGVILTDFFQFVLSMIGMIAAAIYIVSLPEIDGLSNLVAHENVVDKLSFFPDFSDPNVAIPLFIIPIAVQWWSVWYPGAEPGGGGYVAQRMLSAKDEKSAIKATLFFNVAHYALRPWPWIVIALASLVMFPELENIKESFPNVDNDILAHDLAFPAMLTYLPHGLLGLIIASLIAALMSTISTHLNWGSSYIVNDYYKRFVNQDATEKQQVFVGRMSTLLLMILAAVFALYLRSAFEIFNLILQIGAGTGLIFILRWFWWRINAQSEIVAMIVSFLVALIFFVFPDIPLEDYQKMLIGVLITTLSWLVTAYLTRPTDMKTLTSFFKLTRPHNIGWGKVVSNLSEAENLEIANQKTTGLSIEVAMMFLGVIMVYTALFGIGSFVYGDTLVAYALSAVSIFVSIILFSLLKRNYK
ncbi:MAG: Na+:solute symporter [Saprospiraceae bacterium]|nr:Na+:solute symporter [Saprospiraceae bacterium]NNL90929.1 Na+:solute symporter [Saprospiraceae bacterium]